MLNDMVQDVGMVAGQIPLALLPRLFLPLIQREASGDAATPPLDAPTQPLPPSLFLPFIETGGREQDVQRQEAVPGPTGVRSSVGSPMLNILGPSLIPYLQRWLAPL